MNTVAPAPITPEIEQFILWFLNQEEIPVDVRRDMCQYLIQVGTIDEKTYRYIEKKCFELIVNSAIKQHELEEQLEMLSRRLDPANSIDPHIIQTAGEQMEQQADQFTSDLKDWDRYNNKLQETTETNQEQDQVQALKAQL